MKQCSKCGEMLTLDHFVFQSRKNGQYRPDCRACRSARNAEWYQRNADREKTKRREYYAQNRDAILERTRPAARDWYRNNRERRAAYLRKYEYGLSEAGHEAQLLWQGQRCPICWRSAPLNVDHDHATQEVRGLLCRSCNSAIGHLGDDVEGLKKAIRYLEDGAS